ncbi:MAG: hypothetical protein JXR91_10565 [Deltaproteobacteria bacterium]|nr:hypothetical protein [Deltaproteobacteria bacterium]
MYFFRVFPVVLILLFCNFSSAQEKSSLNTKNSADENAKSDVKPLYIIEDGNLAVN